MRVTQSGKGSDKVNAIHQLETTTPIPAGGLRAVRSVAAGLAAREPCPRAAGVSLICNGGLLFAGCHKLIVVRERDGAESIDCLYLLTL